MILETQDDFGESIRNFGDLSVVTAGDEDGGPGRGAVYILYMNTDGTVRCSQKIINTHGGFAATLNTRDLFGLGVTGTGDVADDGIPDIAVTADAFNDPTRQNGTFFVLFLNGSSNGGSINQRPVLAPIGNRNVTEGNQLSISISASDADGPSPLLPNATGLPASATFTDNGNGTFRWTLAAGPASGSPYRVSFSATDGLNATACEEVVITFSATASNDNG